MRAKPTTLLSLHAHCPRCGFNFPLPLEIAYDAKGRETNRYDAEAKGFRTTCDSCGARFVIDQDSVNEIQHAALVLLGED